MRSSLVNGFFFSSKNPEGKKKTVKSSAREEERRTYVITEKRETILYPFESFLAEFGGALGLFLGFSFFGFFGFLKNFALLFTHWVKK